MLYPMTAFFSIFSIPQPTSFVSIHAHALLDTACNECQPNSSDMYCNIAPMRQKPRDGWSVHDQVTRARAPL